MPALAQNLRKSFGLDDPLPIRYARWFTAMVKGERDFVVFDAKTGQFLWRYDATSKGPANIASPEHDRVCWQVVELQSLHMCERSGSLEAGNARNYRGRSAVPLPKTNRVSAQHPPARRTSLSHPC